MKIIKFSISTFITFIVYSYSFLFAQSNNFPLADKCATHSIFSNDGKEKILRTIYFDNNENPSVGQKYYDSPKNIFRIHYDTTGYNAPPMIDKNNNGIPDYVDSVAYYFDYVYDIYINEMGFRSPYLDKGSRGSDHYDVYLWDLGNSDSVDDPHYHEGGTYGLTYFANRDAISTEPFLRTYSYIVIDNDFSAQDSTRPQKGKSFPTYKYPGIPSLKVTVAHEFFHAIQFMYGISQPAATTIMEMTAVAMERVIFPETPDYINYVRQLFRNTASYAFGIDNANTGYGHSIFNQYIIEKFGVSIMRDIWENVAKGYEVYSALDLALKQYNSSLPNAWCEFLDWAYFTGNRSIEGQYFSNASVLPLVEPYISRDFEAPAISMSGNLSPFEFRFLRMIFPAEGKISDDTLDIFLGNIDLKSASQQTIIDRNYFLQVANSEIPNSKNLENSPYYYNLEIDENFICSKSHFNKGYHTIAIDYAYPNPFNKNSDKYIIFPAPEESELYQKVTLQIYDSEMRQIYSKSLPVTIHNNNRIILWDKIPSEISSGVYLFGIYNGENVSIGKFAVVDK